MIEYDEDVWPRVQTTHLWVYDKLILSKYLGHVCGPAGVPLPHPGEWVVKPITNVLGMGLGTYYKTFETTDTTSMLPGTFWMEKFDGKHLSVDVRNGDTEVVYEGIRKGPDRFERWIKREEEMTHPGFIRILSMQYGVVNYEMIGGKIIEVHLRGNPDWIKYKAKELIPVWIGEDIPEENFTYDPDGDRIGFKVIGE